MIDSFNRTLTITLAKQRIKTVFAVSVLVDVVCNVFHTFFAADRLEFDDQYRLDLATGIIQALEHNRSHLSSRSSPIPRQPGRLGEKKYPKAVRRREWPLSRRLPEGTIVSGFSDLVLQDGKGFAIIDHKTFTGNKKEAGRKAVEFSGQLNAYGDVYQKRYEDSHVACYIHYPIIGSIFEIELES